MIRCDHSTLIAPDRSPRGPVIYQLGDIAFNTEMADVNGVEWYCKNIDGWRGTDVRMNVVDLPLMHGSRLAPSYFDSRIMMMKGSIAAPTRDLVRDAWDSVLGLMADAMVDCTALIAYETVPKGAIVRKHGRPNTQWRGPVMTYDLPLIAFDPRKYELTINEVHLSSYVAGSEGLDFGVSYEIEIETGSGADAGFDFSGSSSLGETVLENIGTVSTYPIVIVNVSAAVRAKAVSRRIIFK